MRVLRTGQETLHGGLRRLGLYLATEESPTVMPSLGSSASILGPAKLSRFRVANAFGCGRRSHRN